MTTSLVNYTITYLCISFIVTCNLIFGALLVSKNHGLAFADDCIEGNDIQETIFRPLPPVNGIKLQGAFDIFIIINDKSSLQLTAEKNLLPYISTDIKNDILNITTTRSICASEPLKIVIHLPELFWLSSSGSNQIHITGLNTNTFDLHIMGVSDATVKGTAHHSTIEVEGAGDVDASEFKVQRLSIKLLGSGDAIVWAEKHIDALITGAGSISYKGNPQVTKRILGNVGEIEPF